MTSAESQRHHTETIHIATNDVTGTDSRRLLTRLLSAETVTMATCRAVLQV